jgi:hypothetical protein
VCGLAALNGMLETDLAPRFAPERPGDVKHSQADTARMEALLDFAPVVDFGAGLRLTVAWFRGREGASVPRLFPVELRIRLGMEKPSSLGKIYVA